MLIKRSRMMQSFKKETFIFALFLLFGSIRDSNQQDLTEDNIVAISRNGGRWTFPFDCPSNCRFIQWRPTSRNGVAGLFFTIRGMTTDYVSMAVSVNTDMFGNDDVFICSRTAPNASEMKMTRGYTTGEVDPTITSETPDFFVTMIDGFTICQFFRPLSVTTQVSGSPVTWNLSAGNFNMLYAEGSIRANGSIELHSYRTHTHGAFNYLNNSAYGQPSGAAATTQMNISQVVAFLLLSITTSFLQ